MFVKQLTFAVYMPGQVIAREGQQVFSLLMFIEGKVVASNALPEVKRRGASSDDGGDDQDYTATSESSLDDLRTTTD